MFNLVFRCVLTITSLVFIFQGVRILWKVVRLKKQGNRVIGRVIQMKAEKSVPRNGTSSIIYTPVIEYKTLQNQTVTKASDIGSSFSDYTLGQEFFIYYDSNDINQYIIEGVSFIIAPIICIFIGLGFLFMVFFFKS